MVKVKLAGRKRKVVPATKHNAIKTEVKLHPVLDLQHENI